MDVLEQVLTLVVIKLVRPRKTLDRRAKRTNDVQAARNPSIRRNHPAIWFQLAKFRLPTFDH